MQCTGSILVLDHDPTIVELLLEILTDEGYVAYSARDDAGALAAMARHPPALLLLDVLMPCLHGAALIAQVRAVSPAAMPIVVMTTAPYGVEPLLQPGSIECLVKPFDLDDLLARVARYVRPAAAVDELLALYANGFAAARRIQAS